MRKVDEEISKAENPDGKGTQRPEPHMLKALEEKVIKIIPKGLLIYLYNLYFFKKHTAGQKRSIDHTFSIDFLPDASKSLLGKQNSDERLGDKRFTEKYCNEEIQAYSISHEIVNYDELDYLLGEESDDYL
ncbi:hypothetical protein O181_053415 [Austropuccinia psidii MF-1]|uniref:Uncharacterized protein n=1 Tax=Austropuccinia psidii MF-1 TaxID=1389203 RepID=A0A9Q3HTH5_9BASI|nr:hypothetical protein [Austropuccinia psidii MF-1]